MMNVHLSVNIGCAHQQGMDHCVAGRGQPRVKVFRAILVHQEAYGAAMHPVDRLVGAHLLVQRLQHQAVAAERNDDVSLGWTVIAVGFHQAGERLLRLHTGTRDKGDPLISRGFDHEASASAAFDGVNG